MMGQLKRIEQLVRLQINKMNQLTADRDHWIESYDRLELEYKLLIDELQTLKE